MAERITVVLLLLAYAVGVQREGFRKMNARDKVGMAALLMPLTYLALVFALKADWPNWSDLLRLAFGPPSERIVGMLKGTS